MSSLRCPFYRRDDTAAPECPQPRPRGACLTCKLFPDSRRRESDAACFGTPEQQDEHFMAHYCPEAEE